jgi:hypothetical protein
VPILTERTAEKVAHACNSSYLEGEDQVNHRSRPAWANSEWDHISTNKAGHGGVYLSSQLCTIMVQTNLGKNMRSNSKDNLKSKMNLGHNSSSKVLTQQVQGPEFKPYYHQNKVFMLHSQVTLMSICSLCHHLWLDHTQTLKLKYSIPRSCSQGSLQSLRWQLLSLKIRHVQISCFPTRYHTFLPNLNTGTSLFIFFLALWSC